MCPKEELIFLKSNLDMFRDVFGKKSLIQGYWYGHLEFGQFTEKDFIRYELIIMKKLDSLLRNKCFDNAEKPVGPDP